jgi:hypothetical protein
LRGDGAAGAARVRGAAHLAAGQDLDRLHAAEAGLDLAHLVAAPAQGVEQGRRPAGLELGGRGAPLLVQARRGDGLLEGLAVDEQAQA